MIFQKERNILRQNFMFYLAGMLVVLGIKYYYSQADCDSLLWILAPTTRWVEVLSGIPFTYLSGTGYVNHSLRLLIAPSCSGVQFMLITIATMIFSFVHRIASTEGITEGKRFRRALKGFGWIAVSVIFSWLFTILVNGLRIIVAIYLPMYLERFGLMENTGLIGGLLTPDRLHTMIGVVVYFVALLTLYRLLGAIVSNLTDIVKTEPLKDTARCEQPHEAMLDSEPLKIADHADRWTIPGDRFLPMLARKCLPPIFWYFFMTLGLPFLNRAYLKGAGKFLEYATLIACCVVLILLPYCLVLLLHSRQKR